MIEAEILPPSAGARAWGRQIAAQAAVRDAYPCEVAAPPPAAEPPADTARAARAGADPRPARYWWAREADYGGLGWWWAVEGEDPHGPFASFAAAAAHRFAPVTP